MVETGDNPASASGSDLPRSFSFGPDDDTIESGRRSPSNSLLGSRNASRESLLSSQRDSGIPMSLCSASSSKDAPLPTSLGHFLCFACLAYLLIKNGRWTNDLGGLLL